MGYFKRENQKWENLKGKTKKGRSQEGKIFGRGKAISTFQPQGHFPTHHPQKKIPHVIQLQGSRDSRHPYITTKDKDVYVSIHHSCRLEFTNQARKQKDGGRKGVFYSIVAALLVEKYISELAFSIGLSPQNQKEQSLNFFGKQNIVFGVEDQKSHVNPTKYSTKMQ